MHKRPKRADGAHDPELRDTIEAAQAHHLDGAPPVPQTPPEYSKSELYSDLERVADPVLDSRASSDHDKWLAQALAHLSTCQEVRQAIGWDEIIELIDLSWLKQKGFGPSTVVDIGALKGKLIGEPVPRTSGPPKPTVIQTGIPGLTRNLTSGVLTGTPTSVVSRPVARAVKKRGRKSGVLPRVLNAMRADLSTGALTAVALDQMLEKTLKERYGASRDTCRKARDSVLTELNGISAKTK